MLLTGISTGVAAAALTWLLDLVQRFVWSGPGTNLLDAAEHDGRTEAARLNGTIEQLPDPLAGRIVPPRICYGR